MASEHDAQATIPPIGTDELAIHALPDADIDPSSSRLLASELEHLRQRREAHQLPPPDGDNLTGLALSGGGIRSATFSLGVLQALAKYKLLKHFDYLSTVSGGGYIGSSLTWWLSEQSGPKPQLERGAFGVGKQDFPYGTDNPAIWRGQLATEPEKDPGPKLLTTLRKHGNYLTPGGGITVLSGVAVVLRAVLLNLLVWLPLLILVMLGLLGLLWRLFGPAPQPPGEAPVSEGTLWLLLFDGAIVAALLVTLAAIYFLVLQSRDQAASDEFSATTTTGEEPAGWRARFVADFAEGRQWGLWTAVSGLLVVVLLWLLPPQPREYWHGLRLLLLGAGILASTFVLLSLIYSWATWLSGHLMRPASSEIRGPSWAPWLADDRMRRASYQMRRLFESWAAFYLPLIAGLALIGLVPDIAEWLRHGRSVLPDSGAGGGMLALLAGIAAAGAAFLRSGARVNKLLRERGFHVSGGFTAVVAAALLLFGVLLIAHDLALRLADGVVTTWILFVLILVLAASALIVNLNHISLGRFYRDRLMEAFMPGYEQALDGATGAVPAAADEMKLHHASTRAPYHIINTNVVLVNAKDRRRCLRGGDNFILTPEWCGSNATGWRRTRTFMDDGMTLATAMAISGAAANPNTGVGGVGLTRSRVVSVLMTLLNLRLGYWVPHPCSGVRQDLLPNHVRPGLLSLLFGHREDYAFQELTDGGHFENLAIYELIRRRVRLILVCDGGQDPEFGFEDLQNALRRAGEDFGAKISFRDGFEMKDIMSQLVEHDYPRGLERALRGFAVADVHYPPDFDRYGQIKKNGQPATLIYLKTTLVEGLPLELLGYRAKNPDFPDQSTGDQFFDEDQFEAYRELGFRIAKAMIEDEKLNLPGLLSGEGERAEEAAPSGPGQRV